MKKKPKNGFLKENTCPYCDYECTSATLIGNETVAPKPGDLSFCLMCCGAFLFDEKMNFVKFDLNSIPNIMERIRLRDLQIKMEQFWESKSRSENLRRETYLRNRDKKESLCQ